MVIKVHDVFVVQRSVQLDFSVNLAEGENKIDQQRIKSKKEDKTPTNCDFRLRAFTFSRWCGLETRACGMILAA